MQYLSQILGRIFKFIYEWLVGLGNEPTSISYYALALLAMAVIYKLITIPLTIQSAKQTAKTQALAPQLEEIKKKYGYDQQIYQKKVAEFQKENNVSQAGCSGCLLMILQLVIVMALFRVIKEPGVYLFDDPEKINHIAKNFFWVNDLSLPDPGYILIPFLNILPLLNSLSQLLVTMLGQNGPSNPAMESQKTMFYMLPLVFFFLFRNMPAGLVLYWTAGNIIEIIVKLITKAASTNKNEVKEV